MISIDDDDDDPDDWIPLRPQPHDEWFSMSDGGWFDDPQADPVWIQRWLK